ncbi:Hypothetical protein KLENKIAIHU_3710, partial [Klenkia terrae]
VMLGEAGLSLALDDLPDRAGSAARSGLSA